MGVKKTCVVKFIRKGETGAKGEQGAVLRGPQAWSDCATGYAFKQGAPGEAWLDVVLYNNYYYRCKKSHTKAANNYPGSTIAENQGLWELGDSIGLVATKILLAEYALVKNLGVETIDMKDGQGNILFQAKNGNVICKTGTFDNVTVKSGTVGGFDIGTNRIGTTATTYGSPKTGIDHGRIIIQNSASSTGLRYVELDAAGGSSKIRAYSDYDIDTGLYIGGKIGTAIWAETGVFAGLRPQHRYLSNTSFPYTLRWDDYNVFIHNTSEVTLSLPSNPQLGQAYQIIKTGSGMLKINCNGSTLWWKGSSYNGTFNMSSNNCYITVFCYSTNAWVASFHIED